MGGPLKAVFLDVDGVLVDSLPQHLQICRDKASQYGLQLAIPTPGMFRSMVRRGVKVSPMLYFFLAVGFPRNYAERAVADYESEFMERYRPTPFPGIDQMLLILRGAGLRLGLVTSNTRENVVPVLRDVMDLFDDSCLFFFDRKAEVQPKSRYLIQGASGLRCHPADCVYVGDQPADAIAAQEAGFQFLGVTYGWGIEEGDTRFESVNKVTDIPGKLVVPHGRAS